MQKIPEHLIRSAAEATGHRPLTLSRPVERASQAHVFKRQIAGTKGPRKVLQAAVEQKF
jgi:hypothetical protein